MKLNKTIFRVGDRVKIINPEFFVRVGYPLTKEIAKETLISQKQRELICHLLGENYVIDKVGYADPKADDIFMTDSNKYGCYYEILDVLAYHEIAKRNFGGKERKIYTKTLEEFRNKEAVIQKKRTVKTGEYHHGRNWGDGDYDPPYLSDEKSHIILTIDISNCWNLEAREIESINLEKL